MSECKIKVLFKRRSVVVNLKWVLSLPRENDENDAMGMVALVDGTTRVNFRILKTSERKIL